MYRIIKIIIRHGIVEWILLFCAVYARLELLHNNGFLLLVDGNEFVRLVTCHELLIGYLG